MDIDFICHFCGKNHTHSEAKQGCSACHNSLFRVARTGISPLIQHPTLDVYRQNGDNLSNEEDGYKLTTPGSSNGDIGDSGMGSSRFRNEKPGYDEFSQNLYQPRAFDSFERDNGGSDQGISNKEMFDQEAGDALSRSNNSGPKRVGVHNMQNALPYFKSRAGDLYDRMMKFRKEQTYNES